MQRIFLLLVCNVLLYNMGEVNSWLDIIDGDSFMDIIDNPDGTMVGIWKTTEVPSYFSHHILCDLEGK